jgi:hypothetical protein
MKNMANSIKEGPIHNEILKSGHDRDSTAREFVALRLFSPCILPSAFAGLRADRSGKPEHSRDFVVKGSQ